MSEFGAGIVVCLAKFSEHLWTRDEARIWTAIWWAEQDEASRAKQKAEAQRFPHGDAARRLMDVRSMASHIYGTDEAALSNAIEMWMNAASDHFYDLDRAKAPPSLIALADLTLEIGHGWPKDTMWNKDTVDEIRRLWKESCLEVDMMLQTTPDWGEW